MGEETIRNEALQVQEADMPDDTVPETAAETEIEQLTRQLAETTDQLLRTAAEYDNYRKRTAKELTERYADAQAAVLKQLLPVIDNFGRAAKAADTEPADYRQGVEMIYRQMMEVLGSLGVEPFGQAGDLFDPNLHNAVMQVPDECLASNTLVEVFELGYRMKERILRYATVTVAAEQ